MKRGWIAIVGCLLVDISVGEFNLLSHLYGYFASYFKIHNKEITHEDMRYIPMIWLLTQSIVSPVGIAMFKHLGYKGSFSLFLFLFGAGQIIASYITDFWLFLPFYAVMGGIAQGGCIILPLYCGWRYFPPSYKPKISGILLSAYALAPILSSSLAKFIVNPDDLEEYVLYPNLEPSVKYFPNEVANNIPKFLLYFGIGSFSLGMIGVLLIQDPLPTNAEEQAEANERSSRNNSVKSGGSV
jgi:MFS family permease